MAQPADVIREALLDPIPCPTCGMVTSCRCATATATTARTEAMAVRIVERLTEHGMLHTEPARREATQDDIDEMARWLAGKSRHPRYTQVEDGWRQLLASEGNITHAHAAAVREASPASQQTLADLAAAKSLLIGWLESRRADTARGV